MFNLPTYKTLELELNKNWLTIWFNRPEAKNAISDELVYELIDILTLVKNESPVRGVVIRGRNGVFCAGGDIKMFQKIAAAGSEGREIARKLNMEAAAITNLITQMPQVIVTLVEGAAMAGGFGIACASDIVISTADAKYGISEVRIGLVPAQIIPHIINKIGFSNAKKMMLLANQINGEKALEIGLADFVANNPDELEKLLDTVKKQLASGSPNALAKTKSLLKSAKNLTLDDYIQLGAEVFADCLMGDEGKEGFAAFIEKRKPSWANAE